MNPLLVLVALAVLAGQASAPALRSLRAARAGVAAESREAHRLTGDEVRRSGARNAFEAIELLRPAWLAPRPRGGALSLGPAAVYLDSREIGSVDALSEIPAWEIRAIVYLEPADVPGDHVRPSILVTSR